MLDADTNFSSTSSVFQQLLLFYGPYLLILAAGIFILTRFLWVRRSPSQSETDRQLLIAANGREYVALSSLLPRSLDIEVLDVLGRSLGLEVLVDGASTSKSASDSGKLACRVERTRGLVTVVASNPSQADPRDVRVHVTEHFRRG